MFLFVQVEGVDKVKPNENIYTAYGTYGNNGEYKYSKPLNGDNYTAPLDKSITFSSSGNSPWGQQNSGTFFLYQWNSSPSPLAPWRGHAVIGPEPVLMGEIANPNEQVTNIGIAADTRGYNTEDDAYLKAQDQNWGASGGYSNIMPFYEFPLNGIVLSINSIFIDEIYCNPSDESGGVWLYLNRRSLYNLSSFENFINTADTTTHKRISYFVKNIKINSVRNSNISGLGSVNNYLCFFPVDTQNLPLIYKTGDLPFGRAYTKTDVNIYRTFQINRVNGSNATSLLFADKQGTNDSSSLDPLNEYYKGGRWFCGLNMGNLTYYPESFSRVTTSATNVSYWALGVENVTPESIKKALATLGLMFAPENTYDDTININSNAERIYVPINVDGFYNGEYKTYKYLRDTPEIFLSNSEKKTYQMFTDTSENAGLAPFINGNPDPSSGHSPIDPNDPNKVDEIEMNTPNLSTISVFNTCYAMNKSGITDLKNYLWNADNNIFERLIENAKLYNKPIDAIVRLMLFPFDVRRGQGGTVRNVVFGREKLTGVNGVEIPNNMRTVFDLGFAYLYRKFEDFRDFEPYTTATLYIPYCSPVNLNTTIYQGKKISVKLAVDYNTGDCTAVIYGDGIPLDYSSGKCGVSIAVSAADSSRHDMKVVNDVIKTGEKVAEREAVGALESAFQTFQDFGKIDILQKGAPSSGVAQTLPQYCYMVVTRPESDEQAGYNRTIGYACNKWQTLGSKQGFVVIENPQLDGLSATEQEKEMLKNLLENGVYI